MNIFYLFLLICVFGVLHCGLGFIGGYISFCLVSQSCLGITFVPTACLL